MTLLMQRAIYLQLTPIPCFVLGEWWGGLTHDNAWWPVSKIIQNTKFVFKLCICMLYEEEDRQCLNQKGVNRVGMFFNWPSRGRGRTLACCVSSRATLAYEWAAPQSMVGRAWWRNTYETKQLEMVLSKGKYQVAQLNYFYLSFSNHTWKSPPAAAVTLWPVTE